MSDPAGIRLDRQDLRLLRAAVLPPEPAAASWEAWVAAGGDLDVVAGEAYRLLPQLWSNLVGAGCDDPELGRLSGIYRHVWVTNHRLLAKASRAVGALEAAGIETILLKGGALVTGSTRGVGTRPMEDLDVLIHPSDIPRAYDVLAGLGYHRRNTRPLADIVRAQHGCPVYRAEDEQIDVHWSALQVPGDERAIWAAAVPVLLTSVRTRVPASAHQLLVIGAHGLRWPRAPLRWVADAALLLQSGPEIDWELFVAAARDRDLVPEALAALRLLRDEFELPVPDEPVAALRAAPVSRPARLVHALRHAPHHAQVLLMWTEAQRRVRARPYTPAGAPADLVDHMRIVLDLPTRRAVGRWAARRGRAALAERAG